MPMLLIIPGNARVLTRSGTQQSSEETEVPRVPSRLLGSTGEKKRVRVYGASGRDKLLLVVSGFRV